MTMLCHKFHYFTEVGCRTVAIKKWNQTEVMSY